MINRSRLGVMQGRLSAPINEEIQAFPISVWQKELAVCEKLGLGCLEWVYEYPTVADNPLNTRNGAAHLAKLLARHRVRVNSVVADYFMIKKLFGVSMSEVNNALKVFEQLIDNCAIAKIPLLELPFVDRSALRNERDRKKIVENLAPIIRKTAKSGVRISLETSLEPKIFRDLIDAFKPVEVFANYDMGNSAALGYDPTEEITLLGNSIANVHIKDRVYNGKTVPLGEGDTDFPRVFRELNRIGYRGDYILQAARQDLSSDYREPDCRKTISSYIEFILHYLTY